MTTDELKDFIEAQERKKSYVAGIAIAEHFLRKGCLTLDEIEQAVPSSDHYSTALAGVRTVWWKWSHSGWSLGPAAIQFAVDYALKNDPERDS